MTVPAVSVVLPTYNRCRLLERSVRSVLAQTFDDLELIVVDDGSTDDTAKLLSAIDDPRLVVHRIERSGSAAIARNRGLSLARANWVAFQDSDDVWLLDKLERQMRALQTMPAEMALLCGGYIVIPRQGKIYFQGASEAMQSGQWDAGKFYEFVFITPTWLARRDCLLDLGGFDEEMPNLEDWELALRLRSKYPVYAMNEPLVVKYASADSLNSMGNSRIQSIQHLLQRHAGALSEHPSTEARLWSELGRIYCLNGNMQEGRAALYGALKRHPGQPKYWLSLAAAMFGSRAYASLRRIRLAGR